MRRVCTRRFRIRQASIVLPRPTSSASSQRTGSLAVARSATWSWCGNRRTRPPRNEPRPSASRTRRRCRMSSRVRKSRGVVEVAEREPIEQRAFELQRPQRVRRLRRGRWRARRRPSGSRAAIGRFLARRGDADRPARAEVDRHQRVGAGGQPQRRAGARELDDERPPVDRRHAADAEFGIEAVGEVVARGPGAVSACRSSPAARDSVIPRRRIELTALGYSRRPARRPSR